MIKGILFDLDNTLIDFMTIKRSSCQSAVDAMIKAGLDMRKEDAMKMLFEEYGKHGIEYNYIFQSFLKRVGNKIDYRILASGITAYRKKQITMQRPYSEVVPTLEKLRERGLKTAVLSDAPRLKAWIRLTELGIQDHFDVVLAFGDFKERKPSPVPFRLALKKLGINAQQCLMVGDNPNKDVVGAQKLGIKTCFAKYGYLEEYMIPLKESEKLKFEQKKTNIEWDFEINKIDELLEIVT